MKLSMPLKSDVKQERTNKSLLLAMKQMPAQDHSDTQQCVQDAEDEIASLRKQLSILKGVCEKARTQHSSEKQRIDELLSLLHDKETHLSALKEALEEERDVFRALELENENLKHALLESQQHGKQLERATHFLRERGEEAQLEIKQLTEEYQNLNTRFQASEDAHVAATNVNQQIANENEQLRTELNSLAQQKQQIDEHLNSTQQSNQEKERSLKTAQQHLAKKMKEAAILSEKLEEQRNQIIDLQRSLSEVQAKTLATQEHTTLQLQHEKRLQEQLQEVLKNTEVQVKRWEESYFQMYAKWQETEAQNKALRALEEKQYQIQALLASMGSIVNPSLSQSLQTVSMPEAENEQPFSDKSSSTVRYKQTLFD